MRNVIATLSVIFFAVIILSFTTGNISRGRETLRQDSALEEILPSSLLNVVSLDFRGIFSDVAFFNVYMFYGGKILRQERLTEQDWESFYKNIDTATDLDPYFLDPYYMGALNLAWQANMVDKSNALLAKGARARTWDWTLPFYLGFNYFYFLGDNKKASEWLIETAKRPGGAGGLVPTLAARLAQAGGETESAVAFLENVLRKTSGGPIYYIYNLRLDALKRVLYLQRASARYRKTYGRFPGGLEELVEAGIIPQIPRDPYGGSFYITGTGEIKTTSNFIIQNK